MGGGSMVKPRGLHYRWYVQAHRVIVALDRDTQRTPNRPRQHYALIVLPKGVEIVAGKLPDFLQGEVVGFGQVNVHHPKGGKVVP